MNFEADGKKINYKFGLTPDIMKAIQIAHDDNVFDCIEVSENFKGKSIKDTCKNIFEFLTQNIKYKVDPDGVQWIRTPARLWQDREGDCKSYSLFACCMLSALGIKNSFRFVDYGNDDYTHVYTVAYDENDKPIIIDAVAYQCQGMGFNSELKYKKNKDMKNREKTQISFLSGVSVSGRASDIMEDINFNGDKKANQNYLSALLIYCGACENLGINNETTDNYLVYEFTNDFIIEKYGESVPKLQVAGYVVASHLDELIEVYKEYLEGNEMNVPFDNIKKLRLQINNEIKQYTSNSNEKGEYVLTEEFKTVNANFISWWNKYIIGLNYEKTDYSLPYSNQKIMDNLNTNCLAFVYCICSENLLSKKARKKKVLQMDVLTQYIAGSIITTDTALIYIDACIMNLYGVTPNEFVSELKSKKSKIGLTQDDAQSWLKSLTSSFTDIWGAIKGNGSSNSGGTSTNVILPAYSDYTSSSNWVLYGGLILGGIFILTRNKNNRK